MSSYTSTSIAPLHRIPPTSLVVIEYPGPVASTSTSEEHAIETLGGLPRLSKALSKPDGVVELNFRPRVAFSHALGGTTVEGRNLVLIKVAKKRRRKVTPEQEDGRNTQEGSGVYTVRAVGTVHKVVRFRAMADLQYEPSNAEIDNTVKLAKALRSMDVDGLQAYRFPDPSEDFESDLNLLPPPVFSRLSLPQIYAFRSNPLSTPINLIRPDGSESTRLVNKTKYRGEVITAIMFDSPPEDIPKGPPTGLTKPDVKQGADLALIERIKELLDQRPIWIRNALLNQLTRSERSKIQNAKLTLPCACWTFADGPFRDSCIRFGYDPRSDKESRFYQRIMIRNMSNNRIYLKNVIGANTRGVGDIRERTSDESSHIFDGIAVHRNIGNYQLCDITEPYLQNIIQNEDFLLDVCDYRDGWWDGEYIEFIRQILRRKFFSLLERDEQLPDDAFEDLHTHLREYAAQKSMQDLGRSSRRLTSVLPPAAASAEGTIADCTSAPSDTAGLVGDGNDETMNDGEQVERDETPSLFATGKKISSLRHKSKRNTKPRAKAIGDESDKGERLKSRLSQTAEPEIIQNLTESVSDSIRQDTILEETDA